MPEPLSNDLKDFEGLEDDTAFKDTEVAETPGDTTPGAGAQPADKKDGEETDKPAETPADKPEVPAKEEDEEEDEEEEKPEPSVPLHRFQQVTKEIRELRQQIAKAEQKPASEMTEEERQTLELDKLLEKRLEKLLDSRAERQQKQDEQDAAELADLQETYGEFKIEEVLDIKEEFKKVGTVLSNEGALKVYFERNKSSGKKTQPAAGQPTNPVKKPKVPQPASTTPNPSPADATPVDLSKPLSVLVEEAKKKHGLKD